MEWNHKDHWTKRGTNFCIEIIHYSETYDERLEHRWNVEAYIYPPHAHFKNFTNDKMWQPAACALPLHCGPSFFSWHKNATGETSSVQVGADYNHLYDDRFSLYESREMASEVFRDADALFKWLEDYKPEIDIPKLSAAIESGDVQAVAKELYPELTKNL